MVIAAEKHPGYGNYVRVRHSNGYESGYAHLSAVAVRIGDCLKGGDLIGNSGRNSTQPALHFELLVRGRYLDPIHYVANK
jgi:murein DD-endopeptidase MepM/ murein hydrolase activator NlpD